MSLVTLIQITIFQCQVRTSFHNIPKVENILCLSMMMIHETLKENHGVLYVKDYDLGIHHLLYV